MTTEGRSYAEHQDAGAGDELRRGTAPLLCHRPLLLPAGAAYFLRFVYYNFYPIRQTLRVTPAMEAGDHGSCLGTGRIAEFLNRVNDFGLDILGAACLESSCRFMGQIRH